MSNNEKIFDLKFDFEKYINERLLEITDEGERKGLKDVVKASLIPFYQETEKAYHELEFQLYETGKGNSSYDLVTTVAPKEKVDLTNEMLYPMQPNDLDEVIIDAALMVETLNEGNGFDVMKIYLDANQDTIRNFISLERKWSGLIYTNEGEYKASFRIKHNTSYLAQLNELYQVFEDNGISWKTICAPQLYKFFDVEVVETDCPDDEEIYSVKLDFQEMQDYVRYNMVPMWNLREVEERTSSYPDFAVDKIHYDHVIYKEKLNENRDYMVIPDGIQIWEVYSKDKNIHIICNEDQPVKFKMYEFNYEILNAVNYYGYDVFHNKRVNNENSIIHTMAHLKRFVRGLGYESYIKLVDIRQEDEYYRSPKAIGYNVNAFLSDEIRTSSKRNHMVMVFAASNVENIYNEDILSYIVSAVQWILPEFECVGEYI